MTYREFIPLIGNELQKQLVTNVRYNKDQIVWLLLLSYVLDTYEYFAKNDCYEFERRSTILRILEDISKHLGAYKLTLDTI